MRSLFSFLLAISLVIGATPAHAESEKQSSPLQSFGGSPVLPEPKHSLIPTVNIAPVKRWSGNERPHAPQGFSVQKFASALDHPRWVYVLPNGDVLVAESNAPPKPEDAKGLKGMVKKQIMKKAGASVQSANRITLLRDTNHDGVADQEYAFLENLNSPFGMALVGDTFYVADTDGILAFPYKDGDTRLEAKGRMLADLPAGPINHHWTKNIIASPDGKYLFATVGSNSNVGENGLDAEKGRAEIRKIELETGKSSVYAWGLRNPNGMDWQPQSGVLWTAVNERDELGDNLVPDYMTSVKDGGFYGWPYSYYGQHVDERVENQRPDLVAKAIKPDYALGAHTASLGLTFYDAQLFPEHYKNGAFIGQHGSWNREKLSGYKVIFIPFENGRPAGMPEDFLTGFLDQEGNARGRPVGVAVDKKGALLVADDVGNSIWHVAPISP